MTWQYIGDPMNFFFFALTWNAIALSPHSYFQNHFQPVSQRCKRVIQRNRHCIVALQTDDEKNKELHYMTKQMMNDNGKALLVEGSHGQTLHVSGKLNRHIRSWKCSLAVS